MQSRRLSMVTLPSPKFQLLPWPWQLQLPATLCPLRWKLVPRSEPELESGEPGLTQYPPGPAKSEELANDSGCSKFWRPFTSSLNLGEDKLCPKLRPSHAGSLPFRFWEKIPPLWNTAWFLVEQDNLIHCLISSDTKWPFMGAWSHGQQWEKVQKRKADALWIHQPQSFFYSLFLGKQGCEVKLSSTESADSLNPIFLGLINGSISGFIWSSLNLGTELTHSARNIVFFFIFLKFFMIMVQKWSLGFPPQPLLTLSLSFEGVSLFVCLRALYSLHYWVLLKNGRLLCLKDYTIYVLL